MSLLQSISSFLGGNKVPEPELSDDIRQRLQRWQNLPEVDMEKRLMNHSASYWI